MIHLKFQRDPVLKQLWINKLHGDWQLPQDGFIPSYNPGDLCKHNCTFDPDDNKLIRIYDKIQIFSEYSEKVCDIPVYGRQSIGECKCLLQPNTHTSLLQNIGNGKFVDYFYLYSAVLKFTRGMSFSGQYTVRKEWMESLDLKTYLTCDNFDKACTGFARNVEFRNTDFQCDVCSPGSDTPAYITLGKGNRSCCVKCLQILYLKLHTGAI